MELDGYGGREDLGDEGEETGQNTLYEIHYFL